VEQSKTKERATTQLVQPGEVRPGIEDLRAKDRSLVQPSKWQACLNVGRKPLRGVRWGAHLSTADLGGTTNHLFSSSLTFDVASDTTAITTLKVGVIRFGPLNSKVPDIYNILVKTGAFRGMAESFSGSCLHRLCEMSNDVEVTACCGSKRV